MENKQSLQIHINLTQFISKQHKEEQSAKLYEDWHQLIKQKLQGSKQDETRRLVYGRLSETQQKSRRLTPNQPVQKDQDIIKDIENIKFRLHKID
ncbi:unnamed protein product [Paramecium octaurelia]|uniref:Uncharacterized protein n=1 Tax=Paramecium octaurelia TaxID=43137 RepID=A0A8S1TZ73_PAROT|nr:unnamed protein product [Paramecium octaurelia]